MVLLKLPTGITSVPYVTSTIHVIYPQIYGLTQANVQYKINQDIYHLLKKVLSMLQQPDLVTVISGTYEFKTNERDVLSLTLNYLGDFHGAHPITVVKALTTDVTTGKNYQLKDLFKPESDYVKVLSKIIEEQIAIREIPLLDGFKGIRPDQDYYIADKSLVIYFQQVEITPYYVGFPYFVIPIYDISDIILESGPLGKMVEFF